MTRKVFWEDPYRTTLETRVEEVAGNEVVLAATIFYAFSGGQESDEGTIGGRPVLEARKDGARILYRLAPDHGLRPGDPVTVTIDWERRYRLMRLHFAAEIVLELACRRLGREAKIGAHIAADKARIDFATATSVAPLLPAIAAEANEIVVADQPIISAFDGKGQERRYWRVDGFATVPCGGTHLRRTGEIGRIALRRQNPGRGKERIEIRVGDGAAAERIQA
ncbi:MAG: alanyl-tRNA editing protein [Rhodospirillales bacterium]|nr:alanyl-tRNA editing protein [Rhodospirillales bacterium]